MSKKLVWSKVWPARPGLFWFYGWLFKHEPGEKPEICLVEVAKSGNGIMMYITHGHFLYKEEGALGLWAMPDLPELPDLDLVFKKDGKK